MKNENNNQRLFGISEARTDGWMAQLVAVTLVDRVVPERNKEGRFGGKGKV